MGLKKIVCKEEQKLTKFLEKQTSMSYSQVQVLLRNKDLKVNGERVKKDIHLKIDDVVEFYKKEELIKIFYEDDDIAIVFKPRKIETINEVGDDLKSKIQIQLGCDVFAVHRLDRNTEGLVVFAKNLKAKQSLDVAIKNRSIEKFYIAKVVGVPKESKAKITAYLKKDKVKSKVFVSDIKMVGYEEIKTNYRILDSEKEFAILEVALITGKTHQIRAHLSHIGYPILGDDKYGNFEMNKKEKKKYQCLIAYKLIFHFGTDDYLSRLDGLKIEIDKKEIKF